MELEELEELYGPTGDATYLREHFYRFRETHRLAREKWHWEQARVLDIGAHWLHQSVLFANDGCEVIAADFKAVFEDEGLQGIASQKRIQLLGFDRLDDGDALASLETDSIDVILFCEIIEHITFNPVAMWQQLFRVMQPGGRIIVTTPNCYYAGALFRDFSRWLTGWGTGISVDDILRRRTHSPHWKEYSSRELRAYFELLSTDFSVGRQLTFNQNNYPELNWRGRLAHDRDSLVPKSFRRYLYAEVDLAVKQAGIRITPQW